MFEQHIYINIYNDSDLGRPGKYQCVRDPIDFGAI